MSAHGNRIQKLCSDYDESQRNPIIKTLYRPKTHLKEKKVVRVHFDLLTQYHYLREVLQSAAESVTHYPFTDYQEHTQQSWDQRPRSHHVSLTLRCPVYWSATPKTLFVLVHVRASTCMLM